MNRTGQSAVGSLVVDRRPLSLAPSVEKVGLFRRDLVTGAEWWSPGLRSLLGLPEDPDIHVERGLTHIFEPDIKKMRRAIDVASAGTATEVEHRYWRMNELRVGQTNYEPVQEAGRVSALRGTFIDIGSSDALFPSADGDRRFQAMLLGAMDVAVTAADQEQRLTHWNPAAERLFGWRADEVLGRTLSELRLGPDLTATREIVTRVTANGRWEGERTIRGRDGTEIPVHLRVTTIHDDRGEPVGLVGVCVDISHEVAARHELVRAHDHLRAVTDSMAEGLVTLDPLGRVTFVNRAAQLMLGWTADELEGEVMHDLVHHHHRDGREFPLTECPIFQVQESGEPRTADDLFVRRDGSELEVAFTATPLREAGRADGVVVVFEDVTERRAGERDEWERLERLAWVGRIREGLERSFFRPYAQPIVDLWTGETVEHELLVRMVAEDGRTIAPIEFLPTAEEHGLIVEIDKLMLEHAIRLTEGGNALTLNLSGQTVAAPNTAEHFARRLRESGIDPSLLIVEVTETALIANERAAKQFLSSISELGCRFALDDFGTGYGGFTYLKHLPVDLLKIDREFVGDLTSNNASRRVVAAVVELARGFGQKTIAEGVEDEETATILQQLGVDFGQGYLYGRPAPAEEALRSTKEISDGTNG
jgi:PAS domain S-box-containing protein